MEHKPRQTESESYDSLPEEKKLEVVAFCLVEALKNVGLKDTLGRIEWVERALPEKLKRMAIRVYMDAAENHANLAIRERVRAQGGG